MTWHPTQRPQTAPEQNCTQGWRCRCIRTPWSGLKIRVRTWEILTIDYFFKARTIGIVMLHGTILEFAILPLLTPMFLKLPIPISITRTIHCSPSFRVPRSISISSPIPVCLDSSYPHLCVSHPIPKSTTPLPNVHLLFHPKVFRQVDNTRNRSQTKLARNVLVIRSRGVEPTIRECESLSEETKCRWEDQMKRRFCKNTPGEDDNDTYMFISKLFTGGKQTHQKSSWDW